MSLAVRDTDGAAVGGADVALYIWNEVGNEPSLHSAFQSKTESDGTFTFDLGPGDCTLSVLPLNHVFERLVGHYVPLFMGVAIAYAESVVKLSSNMLTVAEFFAFSKIS